MLADGFSNKGTLFIVLIILEQSSNGFYRLGSPQLKADDGKILAPLPIGNGTDGGGFNPNTMEEFSSQRDGTLTIIKETSPTSFSVEQNVKTRMGCKTCSLDSQSNQIIRICTERAPQAAGSPLVTNAPASERRGSGRGGPGNLDVLWVGH